MGDIRFDALLQRVVDARDRAGVITTMDDDEVVGALAAASRAREPLLANVLATETMNRMRRATVIARHLGEGALGGDVEGRCTFANRTALATLGLSREAMLGAPLVNILGIRRADGTPERGYDPVARAMATGKAIESSEHALTRSDGEFFMAALTCAPVVRDDDVQGCVVTFRDITPLLEREEKLREANAFLQASIDALPLTLAILDGDARIVTVNAAWREFAEQNGLRWQDLGVGRSYVATCAHAEGAEADEARGFATAIRDILAGRSESFEMEYPCHSPERRRWFLGRVAPFRWQGAPHVVVTHLDITSRKLAELEVRELLLAAAAREK